MASIENFDYHLHILLQTGLSNMKNAARPLNIAILKHKGGINTSLRSLWIFVFSVFNVVLEANYTFRL
jgi:hypothetical protein